MMSEGFFWYKQQLTITETQKIHHVTERFGEVYGAYVAGAGSGGCRVPCAGHSGVQTALKPVWAPRCAPATAARSASGVAAAAAGRGRKGDALGERRGGRGCQWGTRLEVSFWKEALHAKWTPFWRACSRGWPTLGHGHLQGTVAVGGPCQGSAGLVVSVLFFLITKAVIRSWR